MSPLAEVARGLLGRRALGNYTWDARVTRAEAAKGVTENPRIICNFGCLYLRSVVYFTQETLYMWRSNKGLPTSNVTLMRILGLFVICYVVSTLKLDQLVYLYGCQLAALDSER